MLAALPSWRQQLALLPVVTWSEFMRFVRNKLNMLAGDEHILEMMSHLQVEGEV
jgi:hypothetical protein